jgi:hypothetical protein
MNKSFKDNAVVRAAILFASVIENTGFRSPCLAYTTRPEVNCFLSDSHAAKLCRKVVYRPKPDKR